MQKRNKILQAFAAFGFKNRIAFYNVCKSIDTSLNGFDLIAFYVGYKVNDSLMNRLEDIIECLKNE